MAPLGLGVQGEDLQDVKYAKASSVDEAIRSAAIRAALTARVLAGGTDIIVQARERRREVSLFVDIKADPGNPGAEVRRGRRPDRRRRDALLPHL